MDSDTVRSPIWPQILRKLIEPDRRSEQSQKLIWPDRRWQSSSSSSSKSRQTTFAYHDYGDVLRSCVWNAVMVSALTQASGREFHSGTVVTKKRMFILSSMWLNMLDFICSSKFIKSDRWSAKTQTINTVRSASGPAIVTSSKTSQWWALTMFNVYSLFHIYLSLSPQRGLKNTQWLIALRLKKVC